MNHSRPLCNVIRPPRFSGKALDFTVVAAVALILGLSATAQDQDLTAYERNTIQVFRNASPGVVHVKATLSETSAFEKREIESGTGSGFVIDREGRILTAFHVIKGRNIIEVTLKTGRRLRAAVVGTAPNIDLAMLQVSALPEELVPLRLGNSRTLQVGQKVLAIGNPVGMHDTLTVGVVSALGRDFIELPLELRNALIQTDAAINPGNSGGPLLDSFGEVIGINDATLASAQNIGFAVPVSLVKRVIPDLISMGHPYRAFLGFSVVDISPDLQTLFALPTVAGLLVQEVVPNSPGFVAGLRAGNRIVILSDRPVVLGGDIIIAANSHPVADSSELAKILFEGNPEQPVQLRVRRDGKEMNMVLRLEPMQMQF